MVCDEHHVLRGSLRAHCRAGGCCGTLAARAATRPMLRARHGLAGEKCHQGFGTRTTTTA